MQKDRFLVVDISSNKNSSTMELMTQKGDRLSLLRGVQMKASSCLSEMFPFRFLHWGRKKIHPLPFLKWEARTQTAGIWPGIRKRSFEWLVRYLWWVIFLSLSKGWTWGFLQVRRYSVCQTFPIATEFGQMSMWLSFFLLPDWPVHLLE